jgi:ABC-type polysaccharide/polyol phosphate transport system ATPase subunit
MTDHVPASLHFSSMTYTLGSRTILDNISGSVKPGQVMAIMGASGAGKSTFLDLLARKRKRGNVSGVTLVNGREVTDAEFKNVIGFVDQEDTLMSTLTVYETILYSALLRLPREMSIEAKKFRTLETMQELGILGIKDMRIGDSGMFPNLLFTNHVLFLNLYFPSSQVTVLFQVARNVEFRLLVNWSHLRLFYSWTNLQAGWMRTMLSMSWKVSFP